MKIRRQILFSNFPMMNLIMVLTLLFCAGPTLNVQASDKQETADFLGFRISSGSQQIVLSPRSPEFERLEFLGDRVLGLATAHFLHQMYPVASVGQIAPIYERLVSNARLAKLYQRLHIDTSSLVSPYYNPPVYGQIAEKTAADIVEVLVGAIHLDGGFQKALDFVTQLYQLSYKFKTLMGTDEHSTDGTRLFAPIFSGASKFKLLQKQLSYEFKNQELLFDAFWHSSVGGTTFKNLNFIGVRALGLVIAEELYQTQIHSDQGFLTDAFIQRVGNSQLFEHFQHWNLETYLVRQRQRGIYTLYHDTVSKRMAADTIRSLIGAIYLDGAYLEAQKATQKLVSKQSGLVILFDTTSDIPNSNSLLEDFTEFSEEFSWDDDEQVFHNQSNSKTVQDEWPTLGSPSNTSNTEEDTNAPQGPTYSSAAEKGKVFEAQTKSKPTVSEQWPSLGSPTPPPNQVPVWPTPEEPKAKDPNRNTKKNNTQLSQELLESLFVKNQTGQQSHTPSSSLPTPVNQKGLSQENWPALSGPFSENS